MEKITLTVKLRFQFDYIGYINTISRCVEGHIAQTQTVLSPFRRSHMDLKLKTASSPRLDRLPWTHNSVWRTRHFDKIRRCYVLPTISYRREWSRVVFWWLHIISAVCSKHGSNSRPLNGKLYNCQPFQLAQEKKTESIGRRALQQLFLSPPILAMSRLTSRFTLDPDVCTKKVTGI